MIWSPPLEEAVLVSSFVVGPNNGDLYLFPENGWRAGAIRYRYAFAVTPACEAIPVLYVTSEVNETMPDAGSHLLGVFSERGRESYGASDEWASLTRFAAQALALAAGRLGIDVAEVEERRR